METINPQQIIERFDTKLTEIQHLKDEPVKIIEKSISLCSLTLIELHEVIVKNGFKNQTEEIFFFKYLKPKVYSKFIYYTKLFKVVCRRPLSTTKIQKRYFNEHLKTIEKYYDDNYEFYQYHRRGLTFLDEKFHTRENVEIPPNMNNLHFLIDKSFSSMQDYTLSTLMANEMLADYIKEELEKNQVHNRFEFSRLR